MPGRQISVLTSDTRPAGSYEVSVDATGLPSGVCLNRLRGGDFVIAKGMNVVQ